MTLQLWHSSDAGGSVVFSAPQTQHHVLSNNIKRPATTKRSCICRKKILCRAGEPGHPSKNFPLIWFDHYAKFGFWVSYSVGICAWVALRIIRWGTKQDSWVEQVEKNFVPHFSKCGGTSKQILLWAYWIYWNLLSGCRINKHRSKDHFHWTAPCTSCTPLVPKVGGHDPQTLRLHRPCM